MLLAAMLAMVLAVAVPVAAQVNTGNSQNRMEFFGVNPTNEGVEVEDSGSDGLSIEDAGGEDGLSTEDACLDQVVERLADELQVSEEEAEELIELVRDFMSEEEFETLIGGACDL